MKGTVFNIQRYAIHDGPGIRTTFFLKGCPLKCYWCHNPEGIKEEVEIIFRMEGRCLNCGDCQDACPQKALKREDGLLLIDEKKCCKCGNCVTVCPTGALEMVGQKMTAKELLNEIEKDSIFYEQSGGGVTFSGGEPFFQPEFLAKVLKLLKERSIHVALDTAGQAPWEHISELLQYVDLFLYDIKHLNPQKHEKGTGLSNELILGNLEKLAGSGVHIIGRFPLIPGFNDEEENIFKTGKYLNTLHINQVHILPFHGLARGKYKDSASLFKEIVSPTAGDVEKTREIFASCGLKTRIGG